MWHSSGVERALDKREVGGSKPSATTSFQAGGDAPDLMAFSIVGVQGCHIPRSNWFDSSNANQSLRVRLTVGRLGLVQLI